MLRRLQDGGRLKRPSCNGCCRGNSIPTHTQACAPACDRCLTIAETLAILKMAGSAHQDKLAALGVDNNGSSGSFTNRLQEFSSPATRTPIRYALSAMTQETESSHHSTNQSLESPSSGSVIPTVGLYGMSLDLTRSPSSGSKGKWRADHPPDQILPLATFDADKLSLNHQLEDIAEREATPRTRYPGPPPAEPLPFAPISPTQKMRSSTDMQRTAPPLRAQHDSTDKNQDISDPSSINGQSEKMSSQQAESNDNFIPEQGSVTSHGDGESADSSGRQVERQSSAAVDSPRSMKSSTRPRKRIPSKDILQAALNLAQQAVECDRTNDIPGAIALYREAVEKLRIVMGRVGLSLERLSPNLGIPEPSEEEKADRLAAAERRRASGASRSVEEGKTLTGIVSSSEAGLFC